MKFRIRSTALALIAALLVVCLCAPAAASEHKSKNKEEHNVADTWLIWAKHGQAKEFEAALKKHAAWRKSAGEPFAWHVYQPVVGSDLNYYVIRSGNHAWADLDTERDWGMKADAGGHYTQDVAPYAKRVKHYFSVTSDKYSHWKDSDDYRYYGVTTYHFNPGTGDTVKHVLEKVHKAVTDAKWPYSYSIDYRIGGHGGMMIVEPMKSYADMADPSPSMMEVLTKSLGSKEAAKKLFKEFSLAVKKRTYTIYVYRPDLSTPK